MRVRDTASDAFLDIFYGVTQQMTFKWNTGIGIGTNNPQYKLDVMVRSELKKSRWRRVGQILYSLMIINSLH